MMPASLVRGAIAERIEMQTELMEEIAEKRSKPQ